MNAAHMIWTATKREEMGRDREDLASMEGGRHRSLIDLRPCDLKEVRVGREQVVGRRTKTAAVTLEVDYLPEEP